MRWAVFNLGLTTNHVSALHLRTSLIVRCSSVWSDSCACWLSCMTWLSIRSSLDADFLVSKVYNWALIFLRRRTSTSRLSCSWCNFDLQIHWFTCEPYLARVEWLLVRIVFKSCTSKRRLFLHWHDSCLVMTHPPLLLNNAAILAQIMPWIWGRPLTFDFFEWALLDLW